MRPANKYHTIFKIWKNTHENHQNCINQTQRRKKIISYLLFSSLCKKHSLTSDFCKRGPETKLCPRHNFPPFRPFLKYAKQYCSLQLLCVAMIASLKDCLQNTGVWEIPTHRQCALPLPLCVVSPCSLSAFTLFSSGPRVGCAQKKDAQVHWSKNTVAIVLAFPGVECWGAGHSTIQSK